MEVRRKYTEDLMWHKIYSYGLLSSTYQSKRISYDIMLLPFQNVPVSDMIPQ